MRQHLRRVTVRQPKRLRGPDRNMNDASHSYPPTALQVVVRKINFFRLRSLPFQKIPGQADPWLVDLEDTDGFNLMFR